MMNIQTVTVIGVTGTMGANVAGIFASFGDAKVYCLGRDIEKVKKTIPRIVKSVKADAIANRLVGLGIHAIWNFAHVDLELVDQDVVVENVHLSDSLMQLSYNIVKNRSAKEESEN